MTASRLGIRLSVVLAAALLLAAACADEDGSGDAAPGTGATGAAATGSATGAEPTASTGSATDAEGGGGRYDYGSGAGTDDTGGEDGHGDDAEVALTADNFAFSPTNIEVKSGSEITVENSNAGTPHTFTVDGTGIDLVLDPGDVEDATIDLDAGTYEFHCRFHASMTGTMTVT